MGLLADMENSCLRMRRECRERFPRHSLQGKPLVCDPGMHHGTCVTHVLWCMSGSLTLGDGENVPIHTYIHCVLSPVTGMSLWTCTVGFCGFSLLMVVFCFVFVFLFLLWVFCGFCCCCCCCFIGGGGGYYYFYSILFSFFLWGLVALPHVSNFIVTCIFSAALLRVSVFSLKISSLVVLGVSLFSHCWSTWSWVSSSWWHILHALSGYLFL